MPYNNTPIAPAREWNGSVSLPLARVKKIILADEDINMCSNNAAFMIAVATEMFLQHLVEQAHNVVKSERRPRRNIQYKDMAAAVAKVDNLEFLADVVPKTMTYKAYREKKAREEAKAPETLPNGQKMLDPLSQKTNGDTDVAMQGNDAVGHNVNMAPVLAANNLEAHQSVLEIRRPNTSRMANDERPPFDPARNLNGHAPGEDSAMQMGE